VRGVHQALLRYRVLAWVTGVVLATMTVALIWFTVAGTPKEARPGWYAVGWVAHGWLFVVYLITAVDLSTRVRLAPVKAILVMVAGTIPFASFFAERWVTRDIRTRLPQAG